MKKYRRGYWLDEYGMWKKQPIHLLFSDPKRLLVVCGEWKHNVEHTSRLNRVTCKECLKKQGNK